MVQHQNSSLRRLIAWKLALRPELTMASTCVLSVWSKILVLHQIFPHFCTAAITGHSSFTFMLAWDNSVRDGGEKWWGQLWGTLSQYPKRKSSSHQAPKPVFEESVKNSDTGGAGGVIGTLPLNTCRKASHHFKSALTMSDKVIERFPLQAFKTP